MQRFTPIRRQMVRAAGFIGSFSLAAVAALLLTINATFYESFPSTRLGVALSALLLLHALRHPKILFCREFALYSLFIMYMFIALLWTSDVVLAWNTLIPAVNFILILVLFGSLVTYYASQAVLVGIFSGFLVGAVLYTLVVGFPFVRPAEFSYNAIAGMYLFGLLLALLWSVYRQSKWVLLIGATLVLLIIATTSIKAILGILVGVTVAALVHVRHLLRAIKRNAISLGVIGVILASVIITNDALREAYQSGIDRASLGLEILQTRESVAGYGAFERRTTWARDGLRGWRQDPVFGHGVEAFRSRYGITSHAAPVELLYNFGLVGFALFYSIFVSIIWRIYARRDESERVSALFLGATACYLFISLFSTMYYNGFVAAFLGISTAILRTQKQPTKAVAPAIAEPQ